MSALMIGAGLIAIATITPGPNNLLVMRIAARSGFMSALPTMAGVVAGGLAMWALVMAGASVAFQAQPHLYTAITIAGGAYLCWMGARLIVETFAPSDRSQPVQTSVLPSSAVALFGFQFLNPKSWVLVLTVTGACAYFCVNGILDRPRSRERLAFGGMCALGRRTPSDPKRK